MYLQIMEQIKQRIAVGDWTPGKILPSIRQLSVDLQVSAITVKRAYLELEHEGVIVTRHGKGSQVADNADLGTQLRLAELDQHLEQAARLGAMLGLSTPELEERLSAATERVLDQELK
jgi:GntR family transcriptional regulator